MFAEIQQKTKENMLLNAEEGFSNEELKKIALQSIFFKEKEGFSFGILTVLHHNMFGGESLHTFKAAAAVELLILSFDIFDDLQDKDNLHTPWGKLNPALALNLALGLFSLSTQTINELEGGYDCKQKFDLFNLKAINGQHADLLNRIETEERYIDIVAQKSGSLLTMASIMGASLATNTHSNIIENYCKHLGIAEQIKNDLNDIFSFGKNDWSLRKKSLPILYLLENDSKSIISDYYNHRLSYHELLLKKAEIKQILFDSGSIIYTKTILRKHQLLAIEQLNLLPIDKNYHKMILNLFKIN